MNKSQLLEQLAKKTKLPRSHNEVVLNAAIDIIQAAVSSGQEVKLVGFGTFDRTTRRSRNGRNPKTGTTIIIPEVTVPRFRPGKDFRELVKA